MSRGLLLQLRLGSAFRQLEIPDWPDRITIGSSSRSGLVLSPDDAAPEQVSLTCRSGLYLGNSRDSDEPTRLNGTPVTYFALKGGDVLDMGSVSIRVVEPGARSGPPVPEKPIALAVIAPVAAPAAPPRPPSRRTPGTRRRKTHTPGSLLVLGLLTSIAVFGISWFVETARLSRASKEDPRDGVEEGAGLAEVSPEFAPLEAKTTDPKLLYRRTKSDADRGIEGERYAEAEAVWTDYLEGRDEIPRNITGAHAELRLIREAAVRAIEELRAEVGSLLRNGEVEAASRVLSDRGPCFRGTPHAEVTRDLAARIEAEKRRKLSAPEPGAPGPGEERPAYEAIFVELDHLVGERSYGEALALCLRQRGCPYQDLAVRFGERAEIYAGHADVHERLLRQLGAESSHFRGIPLDARLRVDAVGGDSEKVVIRAGGSVREFAWSRIGPDLYVGLLTRLVLDAGGNLRLAALAFENGGEEVAHRFLARSVREDESLRPKAFALLARHLRIPVPEGGFLLRGDRWLTPDEYRRLTEKPR